jgi:hypothetical protein
MYVNICSKYFKQIFCWSDKHFMMLTQTEGPKCVGRQSIYTELSKQNKKRSSTLITLPYPVFDH